jgi:hypothetical protein
MRDLRIVRIDDDAIAKLRAAATEPRNANDALRQFLKLTRKPTNWAAGTYCLDAEVFAKLDAMAREERISIPAIIRRLLSLPPMRSRVFTGTRRRPAGVPRPAVTR